MEWTDKVVYYWEFKVDNKNFELINKFFEEI